MAGRAIIAGGSIGGLFAAAALRRVGWEVSVHERSEVELSGRGAGIVTHKVLIDALNAVGAGVGDLGVEVTERVAFDREGRAVETLHYPQIVTSWDRIHQLLRQTMPERTYHLEHHVTGYSERDGAVEVRLSNGRSFEADLLVGADGFRSAVRAQFLPEIAPQFSGYVVWRALAPEAALDPEILAEIFPAFGFYLPAGTQIIGYPIAGPGNDLRPGHRRYNFVWYALAHDLEDMLTDASGHRHAVSIPPPLIRDEVLAAMRARAEEMLPGPFLRILDQSERPFFTPIYDHHSPHMARGRVALCGDAACVARPHVGMGVTKAACDALALARSLETADLGTDLAAALADYSDTRVPASRAAFLRARKLGSYIFGDDPETNRDGRANPRLSEIMETTAVTVD